MANRPKMFSIIICKRCTMKTYFFYLLLLDFTCVMCYFFPPVYIRQLLNLRFHTVLDNRFDGFPSCMHNLCRSNQKCPSYKRLFYPNKIFRFPQICHSIRPEEHIGFLQTYFSRHISTTIKGTGHSRVQSLRMTWYCTTTCV